MISTHLVDASALPGWRKSSYSGPEGGECVEVADGIPGVVPIRDSKDPQGPALLFSVEEWACFVAYVKAGPA
ncbi:DUF397 domain-containing protein [Streptomyces sp. NPDC004031]